MNKSTAWFLAAALGVSAPAAHAVDQADYDAALADAKAAQARAASVSGEWRDMGKMLKEAAALATEGKFTEAVELVRVVEQQGNLGYEQMTSQAGKVGPEAFLQ